jgi:hypothetical protein
VDAGIERLEVDHHAVCHRQQQVPDLARCGSVGVDEGRQATELGVVLDGGEQVADEVRLQGRLSAGDGDAGQEPAHPTHVVEHLRHRHDPRPRRSERDGVRVVTRGAAEVATLQEQDVAVARPVDPAERDDVSDQAERRTQG